MLNRTWLKPDKNKFDLCASLLLVYVLTGYVFGTAFLLSNVFFRQELQTINSRFEMRPWLLWSSKSLKRLNPIELWKYHEAHEIPRKWWAWDFTLSWLLENNHPEIKNRFVLFNHLLEDEPPAEAIEHYQWMEPLRQFPLQRKTIAEMIKFLASAGPRMIIIDSDFPQYSQGDRQLAYVIHESSSGAPGRLPVPVLMARTVNRRSSGNVLELEVPTKPSGVLEELSKLNPDTDVTEEFTGITSVLPDEDQVVRRLALRLPGLAGRDHDSLVLKAVQNLGIKNTDRYPDVLEIDFVAPPNSELYPVRSFSYLLDPKRKEQLLHPQPGSADVNIKGAIVVLGDSVVDVFNTPLTNQDANQMSGAEILVQAIDTVCRGTKLIRLQDRFSLLYLLLVTICGGIIWSFWKLYWKVASKSDRSRYSYNKRSIGCRTLASSARTDATLDTKSHEIRSGNYRCLRSSPRLASLFVRYPLFMHLAADILLLLLTLALNYLVAGLLFTYLRLIVPLFVPSLALGVGTLAAVLWEREREREEHFAEKLQAAHDKLVLAQERYEAHLKRQEAEALSRQIMLDQQRRKEFVRRLNHDLNAPVSVLNWTLAELMEGQNQSNGFSSDVKEKLGRLIKNSDKLCELIDQIVSTYDYELKEDGDLNNQKQCDLVKVWSESLDLLVPLAKAQKSPLSWSLPGEPIWISANDLELSRVIDNLVRNALKHNPSGTNVHVQLIPSKSSYSLTISDNGKGIKPEDLEHIFEPGYRVEPPKEGGLGLGLDIVYEIIAKLGGTISVESKVDKGTMFVITLPKELDAIDTGTDKQCSKLQQEAEAAK